MFKNIFQDSYQPMIIRRLSQECHCHGKICNGKAVSRKKTEPFEEKAIKLEHFRIFDYRSMFSFLFDRVTFFKTSQVTGLLISNLLEKFSNFQNKLIDYSDLQYGKDINNEVLLLQRKKYHNYLYFIWKISYNIVHMIKINKQVFSQRHSIRVAFSQLCKIQVRLFELQNSSKLLFSWLSRRKNTYLQRIQHFLENESRFLNLYFCIV